MINKDESEKQYYLVYVVDGIPYLPHYRDSGKYVAPGWSRHPKTYESAELFAMGAKTRMEYLWKRVEFGQTNIRFI